MEESQGELLKQNLFYLEISVCIGRFLQLLAHLQPDLCEILHLFFLLLFLSHPEKTEISRGQMKILKSRPQKGSHCRNQQKYYIC